MTKKRLTFIIAFLSVLLSLWLISITLSDIFERSKDRKRINNALRLNPLKSSIYYYLGLTKHYNRKNPDLKNAIRLYEKALLKNPLYANVWYDLAHAFMRSGNKDMAFSAIQNYYRLSHNDSEGIWNTALFYYIQTGKIDNAIQYMKRLVSLYPDETNKIFNILVLSNVKNDYILSNIISLNNQFYTEYLRYLMKLNDLERAINYWNITNHDLINRKTKIHFCNSLLFNERYADAESLWKELVSIDEIVSSDNLLYNGSFEHSFTNGCFGWFVQRKEGVLIRRTNRNQYDGRVSFEITFDGRHNTDIFALRQFVLVDPGSKYNLSAMIKTDNITTTNGLFLQVYGFKCDGLNTRTATVTGTNDWRQLTKSFKVPSDCRAIVVAVRRAKSSKFNNKIKGTAWVDNIKITKTK